MAAPDPRSRNLALDALRGLAILAMALSEFVPPNLPPWMYHWQNQGPNHDTNIQIFGISWVDLVFPIFLFCMGASIPLAIQRRIDEGASTRDVILWILSRGILLAAFALAGQHLRPLVLFDGPSVATWSLGLLGFAFLVMMFARWPESIPRPARRILTWMGWIGAFVLIVTHPYPDHVDGFANYRVDIILMVLADCAVAGGLIWLATRQCPLVRYAVVAAVLLIFLTKDLGGSGQAIWDYSPLQHLQKSHWPNLVDLDHWPYQRFVPVVYHFEYLKYLVIVLPGTLCGDILLRRNDDAPSAWLAWRPAAAGVIGIAMSVIACIGTMAREIAATSLALTALSLATLEFLRQPYSAVEKRLRAFAELGTAFVIFGLLAEPLGGGIRKASPTASYYLLTTGLAFFLLITFTVVIDVFKKSRWLRTTIELGQNAMLGYIAATNLLPSLFGLALIYETLGKMTNDNQWVLAVVALAETAGVAYATAAFTRLRILMRT